MRSLLDTHINRLRRQKSYRSVRQRPLHMELLEDRRLLAAIFYDSFENGLLSNWTIPNLGNESRVAIRDLYAEGVITNAVSQQFGLNGNEHSLAFDSTRASGDNNKDLGIAILSVDLTGLTDGLLTFHQFEGGDDDDILPDQHATDTPGDGLSVSRDGTTWYRLLNVAGFDINRSGDGLWLLHEYDLGLEFARINAAFNAGVLFDDNIQFKFSQYDDRPLSTDGWAIDELTIQVEAEPFSLDRPRGVFHRFNLAGEDDDDYYFRAAVYGNVDANTPIMVAVHGSNGDTNFSGYSWRWHRFVADPMNGVDSMIVVTPAFVEKVAPGRFNTPVRYTALSWNTTDDAAADIALLDTVDTITATGIGDGSGIYLWGFSAGGQFVGRFTAAHPERVAAAVVGGPSSQILPTEFVTYPHGIGANTFNPPPPGVSLDQTSFLSSRIMYWVGQDDSDPNHSQLERNPSIDSSQGISRRERSIYQFEQMHLTAQQLGIDPKDYEFELLISEGDGHGWNSFDIPEIHEFLFRDRTPATLPIQVHPRIVLTESPVDHQTYLPQNVGRILPGQEFFVELWIEAPAGGTTGVKSGEMELFFDTTLADVLGMEHGLFSTAVSGVVDEAAGRIRNFGGSNALSGAGVDGYALFGRVAMRAGGSGLSDPSRFAIALQRDAAQDFVLEGGQSHRTDFMPFATTLVGGSSQGVTDAFVQGVVFHDANGDEIRQPAEMPLPNREVQLTDASTGQLVAEDFRLEPDESLGHGAYLYDAHAWVDLSAVGTDVINPGVRAYDKGNDESSTGVSVFAHRSTGGFNTLWLENLRSLRMDFQAPTRSVSIDVVAKLGDPRDYGRLEVYNAAGTLLESQLSSDLADGAFESVTVTRPQGDIAYAIATGAGGNNVRLDNLRFTSEVRVDTDANGAFIFKQLPPGDYRAVLTGIPDWDTTAPISGEYALTLAAGDVAADRDFGSSQQSLNIMIDAAWISERGGTTTATVTRSFTDTSQPLTVDLSSDDTSEATIPSTVTIPANQASATFSIVAVDDSLLDGTQTVTITASRSDYVDGTDTIDVTDHETMTVVIAADTISENGGSTTATVTRGNTDIESAVVVNLSNGDSSEISIPTTVTILANQASASFDINAVDDALLDGSQTVSITASASGYVGGDDSMVVTDHETVTMVIAVATISENGGRTTATVTRSNTDVESALVVNLSNGDSSEINIPTAVTIPANQASASFDIHAVDDDLLDGSQTVSISAAAPGYFGGDDSLVVTDHETVTITIVADTISENGGSTTATVTRSNTDIGSALVVNLSNGDSSEISIPATVTIPANQASTIFNINAVDDDLLDGSQTVSISAAASGYFGGDDSLVVTDHETITIAIEADTISENGGSTTAIVARSNIDIGTALVVNLSNGDSSEISIPSTVTIPVNERSVSFTITAVDDNLLDQTQEVIVAVSAIGYVESSDTLDVTDHETLNLSINAEAISERGGTTTATVTRSNTDNSQILVVVIISDDTSEATVPTNVTIPGNEPSATFTITGVDDNLLDGTQIVTITVSANGYISGSDTVDVTGNAAPVLASIGNKSVDEGSLLTFTASAADQDTPANTLTFSLDAGAPAGASIQPTTGVFSWTPTEAQGPGTFDVTIRVTDNGTPNLNDFETIEVTVGEVNVAPVLGSIGEKSVDEGSLLSFTASAADQDTPANTLTFSLDAGAPSGASINANSGVFTWTPTEAQGPGTFNVTVRVSDDGTPNLDDFETIEIAVSEVNDRPTLTNPGNKTLDEKTALAFTLNATDNDIVGGQADVIIYSISAGNQSGMTLDSQTGAFSWTPTEAQDGEYLVTFRAADNHGDFSEQSVTVTVIETNDFFPLVSDAAFSLDENSPVGTVAGQVSASDQDSPSALTYEIVSADPSNPFAIDAVTGVITVNDSAMLDREQIAQFTVQVRVTDSGIPVKSGIGTILVSLNDLDELDPIAISDDFETDEDTVLVIPDGGLLANDLRGDATEILSVVAFPGTSQLGAAIDINVKGGFRYDPRIPELQVKGRGETFTDTFAYELEDGQGRAATGTVTITIHGVNDWHNLAMPLDVNRNGGIEPLDALIIINYLNENGPGPSSNGVIAPEFFYDTNDDGFVSPLDVLLIVNALNSTMLSSEGEQIATGFAIPTATSAAQSQFDGKHGIKRMHPPANDRRASQSNWHSSTSLALQSESTFGQKRRSADVLDAVFADEESLLVAIDHLLLSELTENRR